MKWILIALPLVVAGCSSHVVRYKHGEYNVAFHKDWPTYGLPLAELTAIYELIDSGDTEKAKKMTLQVLELAYSDAEERLKVVPDDMKEQILNSMSRAESVLENNL
jgi:DNA-binding GntR family transcriptional regulator